MAPRILLPAAIAAVLNAQHFGRDYPGGARAPSVVATTSSTLATGDAQYVTLANQLDYRDNGIH